MLLCLSLPILPWFYGLTQVRDQLIAESLIFFVFLLSFLTNPGGIVSRSWPAETGTTSSRERAGIIGFRQLDAWVLLSAALAFIYVPISILPYRSLVIFTKYLSVVVFYFFARCHLHSMERIRILLWVFLVCGIFYSLIGLLQWYGFLKNDFWYGPASLASRYINGGHFANFLYFALFSGMVLMRTSSRAWIQAVIGAGILLMLWAFLLTRTRSAWLGFALGIGLFFWFSGFKYHLTSRKGVLTAFVFAALGGFLFLLKAGPVLMARFQEIWDGTNPPFYSLIFRANTALDCVHAILAHPWGWGIGMFVEVMPQYRGVIDRFLLNYAHNEFLQVGVDFGIAGLFFLAGFILFYFRRAVLFLKKPDLALFERSAGAAFLAIAAALTFTSQADFPLRIFANSLHFSVFLAASAFIFDPPGANPQPKPPGLLFRAGLGGLVFLGLIFSAALAYAQVQFEKAEYLNKHFKWDQAEHAYQAALAAAPMEPLYLGRFASLLEKRMAISRDPKKKVDYRKRAIRLYEQAVRSTRVTDYYYWLARLYESENRISEAGVQFKKAVQLAPKNGFFVSEYGYFALRHLEAQEAVAVFERFQAIPFKEGSRNSPCEILEAAAQKVTNYQGMKRMVSTATQDHLCLGMALGRQEQWEFARQEFNAALEIAQDQEIYEAYAAYFREPIADFYAAHGRPAEALEVLRKSLAFHPGDRAVESRLPALEAAVSASQRGEP